MERGVDAVKIMASGGINTPGTDPAAAAFSEAHLRLMVDLAHEAGLPVAAHAHAAEAIDLVVRIGVETIEHATYVGYGDVPSTDIVGGFLNSRASDEQLAALAAGSALVCATFGGFTVEMLKNAPPVLQQRVAESGLTPHRSSIGASTSSPG